MGFAFEGTFTEIVPMETIKFKLDDDRLVVVAFSESSTGDVVVEETFDAEEVHSADQQRQGWQAILENFRLHVETLGT